MSPAVRPPRPEDIPAIVALGEAFDRALTGTGDWSEEDVEHDWRALADPERDAWVVEDGGAVVEVTEFVLVLADLAAQQGHQLGGKGAIRSVIEAR